MRLSLLALLCLACSFIYCTGASPPRESDRSTSLTAYRSHAELDLGGLAARARNAFRQEAAGLAAHGDGFSAHVDDDGVRVETQNDRTHVTWKLGPSAVARGSGRSTSSRKTELADGAVRMVGDEVEERWENQGDALEQTWRFRAPPRGEGDLVIRVGATGLDYAARTTTGMHFGGGGLGFRYGNATWVDGAGRRTLVNVGWDGDHIMLTVPSAVLEGSTYPAVLDPTISPEIGVDQSVPVQAYLQNGSTKVVASDTGFLVVWHTGEVSARGQIRAVRVDLDGNVLDPLPIVVGSAPFVSSSKSGAVAVAGDGIDSFVTWMSCESASAVCNVKSARVRSSDGAVLDELTIGSGTLLTSLAAARQGTKYFVGWSTSTEVRGSVVENGAVIAGGATGRLYAKAPAATGAVLAAAGGSSNFMVAWNHIGLRINPADGSPLDAAPVAFAGIDAQYPATPITSLAFDGANYYAVWSRYSNLLASRIRASDGQLLDPDDAFNNVSGTIVLEQGTNVGSGIVDFDGTWLFVSSVRSSVVSTIRVDPATGKRSDAPGVALSYPPSGTVTSGFDTAVRNGHGFVVSDINGGAFSITDGVFSTVAGPMIVAKKGHTSSKPVAASNGTDFLVVWEDQRRLPTSLTADLYGARIRSSDRAVLDPDGFLIASDASAASLAFDGTDYLVTYVSGTDAVAARKIRASDAFVGAPVAVGTGTSTALACDGTNCLVAWTKSTTGSSLDPAIEAFRRLDTTSMTFTDASPRTLASSSTGGTLGPISVGVDNPVDPTKKTFLLTWADKDQLRASRVRATSGAAVDVANGHIQLGKGPGSPWVTRFAVASDGPNFLVAWYHNRVGPQYKDRGFYATRIDALNGTVLDGVGAGLTGLMVASVGVEGNYLEGVSAPALVYTGLSYWLSWGAAIDPDLGGNSYSLRGMRLTSALSPLDPPTGAVFIPSMATVREPGFVIRYGASLAQRSNIETLLAYSRYDEAPTAVGNRVKGRILVDDGLSSVPPDAGTDASDASSEGGASADAGGSEGGVNDAGEANDASGSGDATTSPADASNDSGGLARPDEPASSSEPDGAADSVRAAATEDGGCGCRVMPASTTSSWLLVPSFLVLSALRRRRSREERNSSPTR